MDVQWNVLEEHLKKLKGKLIIVEGEKDRKALNSFGISNIITLKKPLFETVEEISFNAKECIILTDLDKEGKKLYARLRSDIQRHGVKIDDSFRNFLLRETRLKQIEALDRFVHKAFISKRPLNYL